MLNSRKERIDLTYNRQGKVGKEEFMPQNQISVKAWRGATGTTGPSCARSR